MTRALETGKPPANAQIVDGAENPRSSYGGSVLSDIMRHRYENGRRYHSYKEGRKQQGAPSLVSREHVLNALPQAICFPTMRYCTTSSAYASRAQIDPFARKRWIAKT